MSLELSYKGLSDQIGVASPNLVRNPFFIADPAVQTLPSGWITTYSNAYLYEPDGTDENTAYTTSNAFEGKVLTLTPSGYIKCDDFIRISGGTGMKGLYTSPLNFILCVFLKGTSSVSASTSGLKVEFFNDDDDLLSSKTTYFNYTTNFSLKTAKIVLEDSDFTEDYKLKILLTNLSSTKVHIKLLSLSPGDVTPTFFLPTSLSEETLNSIRNKPLTLNGSSIVQYDGYATKSISVVNSITSNLGLSSAGNGNVVLENTGVITVSGTSGEILVSKEGSSPGTTARSGDITLSWGGQPLATTSNVAFNNLTLTGSVSSVQSISSTSNVSSSTGTFKS